MSRFNGHLGSALRARFRHNQVRECRRPVLMHNLGISRPGVPGSRQRFDVSMFQRFDVSTFRRFDVFFFPIEAR